MHVPIDKYVFSIDLAQRNRKKTLLNTRFAFSVNLRLASLICRADPRRIKSKTREKSRQTQNRRTIEPRRCQKAIVRFGLNLKKNNYKTLRELQIRITNKTIGKALTNQCGHLSTC